MVHLITGATGNIGGRVVSRLLARGARPRLLVRDAEKARARFGDRVDVVVADLADAATLPAACAGADTVLAINDGPDLGRRDAALATAARAAGVGRLVKLSALSARLDALDGDRPAIGDWHAAGEAAVRSSGVAWTVLQPVAFMSNALSWAGSIKAAGVVRASTGDGRIAMIHPEDIAAVAVAALTSHAYEGETLPLTGPRALSYVEMVGMLGAAIGRALAFEPIGDEAAHQRLLGFGLEPELASALISLWRAVRAGRVAMVSDAVERVLGRPPLAFDQWAAENAAEFR